MAKLKTEIDWDFQSLKDARRCLQLIMRGYYNQSEKDRNHVVFRNIVHAFSVYLTFYKLETDIDIAERLDKLEAEVYKNDRAEKQSRQIGG